MLLLTVISLAPAIMMMTTSFVRIVVVLGVLRQRWHKPTPAVASHHHAALHDDRHHDAHVTAVRSGDRAVYQSGRRSHARTNLDRRALPLRKFMSDQIVRTGNDDDVRLFLDYLPPPTVTESGETPNYVSYGRERR
jgi:flagellar biosynthetic protein FliP